MAATIGAVTDYVIKQVPAEWTFPLRQKVLRPHQAIAEMGLFDDDDPDTGVFAAVEPATSEVVVTATVSREPPPQDLAQLAAPGQGNLSDRPAPWRLRGMATREDLRGAGLGTRVLADCIEHVCEHGGGFLWCWARTPASKFYERAGFVAHGEAFEDPDIGPHVLMWRRVEGGGEKR